MGRQGLYLIVVVMGDSGGRESEGSGFGVRRPRYKTEDEGRTGEGVKSISLKDLLLSSRDDPRNRSEVGGVTMVLGSVYRVKY